MNFSIWIDYWILGIVVTQLFCLFRNKTSFDKCWSIIAIIPVIILSFVRKML